MPPKRSMNRTDCSSMANQMSKSIPEVKLKKEWQLQMMWTFRLTPASKLSITLHLKFFKSCNDSETRKYCHLSFPNREDQISLILEGGKDLRMVLCRISFEFFSLAGSGDAKTSLSLPRATL